MAYQAIRQNSADVHQIADRTGWKAVNIQTVKFHLFDDLHLLDRYSSKGEAVQLQRFEANPMIVSAWLRLSDGFALPNDLQLLRHEMAEAWFMRQHGHSYNAAHNAAQRRYPWWPEE